MDGACLPPQAQQPQSLCFLLLAVCLLSVPARFRARDELLSFSFSGACSGLELPSAVSPSNGVAEKAVSTGQKLFLSSYSENAGEAFSNCCRC